MVNFRKESRVVVHKDEEDQGKDDRHVKDDKGLPLRRLDPGSQKSVNKEPYENAQEDQIGDKKTEGEQIKHEIGRGSG